LKWKSNNYYTNWVYVVVRLVDALRYKPRVRFPMELLEFFIYFILPADSASNRKEMQGYFQGVKAAGA
jgi:hypothetical protein